MKNFRDNILRRLELDIFSEILSALLLRTPSISDLKDLEKIYAAKTASKYILHYRKIPIGQIEVKHLQRKITITFTPTKTIEIIRHEPW